MKVKLEDVERYERHVKMRLAFRFGVITVTDATQAVIRVRISLPDGRTSHGVAAEALAAKWFEKSPAFTDEQNLDQLRQSLDLAIELYRAQGFDNAVRSVRRHLRRAAEARRGAWPQSAGGVLRAGVARSRHPRRAGPGDRAILRHHDRAQRPGHPHDLADAGHRGRRSRPVPGRPEAGAEHRGAPHGWPGRSADGRRPAGGGARERRTAGDPGGGRLLLSRPLLQAEGRRRHQGRSRPAQPHRRRARRRRRRLPRHARRQRAVRRRRGHRRAVAQGRGDAGAWRRLAKSTLFIEQPIKRAVALVALGRAAGQAAAGDHRRIGRRAVVLPDGAEARLCRRLEQELQGLLQVDPERRARAPGSAPAISCRPRISRPGPASACSRTWRWCRCWA